MAGADRLPGAYRVYALGVFFSTYREYSAPLSGRRIYLAGARLLDARHPAALSARPTGCTCPSSSPTSCIARRRHPAHPGRGRPRPSVGRPDPAVDLDGGLRPRVRDQGRLALGRVRLHAGRRRQPRRARHDSTRDTVHNVLLVWVAASPSATSSRSPAPVSAPSPAPCEIEAATRERERLARDIHDSVLQVLAMVQRRGARRSAARRRSSAGWRGSRRSRCAPWSPAAWCPSPKRTPHR